MKTNDSGCNEWQGVTKSDNEWQWLVIWIFFFFRITEESTTRHLLNLEEDLELREDLAKQAR